MTGTASPILAGESEYRVIAADLIDVPAGRRALDPKWVETLSDDIAAHTQRTAIEVLATGERYRLIAGGHRLAAVKQASLLTIKAIVKQRSDFTTEAEIRLAEIVENFMRRELSVLDRAFDVTAWREVFEGVQGAIKPGRKAKDVVSDDLDEISRKFATNFTEAAQSALGLSRDAVFRALKIAKLGDEQRQRIALLPLADNQSELLALVAHKPERQVAIIDRLLDGATSVADALAILDDIAPATPRQPWEKVSDTFSRLKSDQQARFFTLHEDAIAAWMASR